MVPLGRARVFRLGIGQRLPNMAKQRFLVPHRVPAIEQRRLDPILLVAVTARRRHGCCRAETVRNKS